jgi:hypothetical protein
MEKHYVPEIEEFHVGFEYERRHLGDNWISDTWLFHQFSEGRFLANLSYAESIRVKYLDDEDVISLGFNQITHDCFNLNVPLYRGREQQEVRLIIRQTVLIYLAQDAKYNDTDTTNLFTGTIKNKSELKKLLTQLQIL